MFNHRYAGKPYRYAYSAIPEPGWFLFRGLVKHDLNAGTSEAYEFGPGRFGSEAPFAPRIDAKDEDDGYLVSFIADLETDKSEMRADRREECRGGTGVPDHPARTHLFGHAYGLGERRRYRHGRKQRAGRLR